MSKYIVRIEHQQTGERISLMVDAESADAATHKFSDALFGYGKDYKWVGTTGSPTWAGRDGFDYQPGSKGGDMS